MLALHPSVFHIDSKYSSVNMFDTRNSLFHDTVSPALGL